MSWKTGWDYQGISTRAWAEFSVRLNADVTRRVRGEPRRALSLAAWGRRFLPDHFRLPPSQLHLWLGEQLDAMTSERGTRLNVIGPRGGAKSTLGTLAHALRAAVEGAEPYIWIVSDTHHQACAHLENLKLELTGNAKLAAGYPHAAGKGPVWRAGSIRLNNGVVIEAFGTGQSIRGRRSRAHRPTLILCDDLQNDGHMRSALQRERTLHWFEGTLLKAGTHQTNVVNLATALHRDALALQLSRTPGWLSRTFLAVERWPDAMSLWHEWEDIYCQGEPGAGPAQARAFFEQHQAEMISGAELLWPEHEDLYTLMRMRVEAGRAAFEREKQGAPLSADACEWPEDYFDEQIWFDEWPRGLQLRVIALDPSKGRDARRGDFSAYVLLGLDGEGTLLVEADLARRPTPELVAAGVEHCRTFPPDAFGLETNQFQELLATEFAHELKRQGLAHIHPWSIDNHVNKRVRIRRLGPFLAGRRIRFKNHSPGTSLLVDQLREFPAGDHDDGPDALEMAIRLAGELTGRTGAGDNLGDALPLNVI